MQNKYMVKVNILEHKPSFASISFAQKKLLSCNNIVLNEL